MRSKSVLKNLHRYVLWALISLVLWGWVFTFVTDTTPAHKVLLYADLPAMDRKALARALEEGMPEGIRFVRPRVFLDEMFSPTDVLSGDVYIVAESKAEGYLSSFAPIDETAFPGMNLYEAAGEVYGICVFDEQAGVRIGTRYVAYEPGERYYLFFNGSSPHLGQWNDSPDDAALLVAQNFLLLP